ncbi:U1 small nuclear ribonucleoprotein A [Coprinopsis cinerea AmutBmut pab1-1]|nr:U1 small nuclear ribonucleoprotein A [Coprinopsis cinerea AmutBmut pab1-1]
MANSQPNPTLYINNLNEKITKEELKTQLYALFTTYGRIIDIVASKGPKMRGQAFLVFADLAGATTAMRACEGMLFYDKPMRITYAKTKSYATLSREDPNFVPPNAANASSLIQNGKRTRDEDKSDERQAKREKSDESSDEEMEIEDDDEAPSNAQQTNAFANATSVPQQVQQPTATLLCTNLPQEVTNDVLSVLFQQYQGILSIQVVWSPQPNPDGTRVKMAQVIFESPERAVTAKEALDGFTLKKGWVMSVSYM